jgi:hypothetical protein
MSNVKKDPVGQILRFNTGRGYSAEGQKIEAQVLCPADIVDGRDRYVVRFADRTRMIYGEVTVSEPVTQRAIMAEYDAGGYVDTQSFTLEAEPTGQED